MERDFLVLAGHKFWWVWFLYFLSTVITLFAHRETSRLHTCINITLLLDNPLIVLFKSLRDPSVCFIDSNIHCTLCKGTRKAISVILETPQPWFPHELLSGEEIVRRERWFVKELSPLLLTFPLISSCIKAGEVRGIFPQEFLTSQNNDQEHVSSSRQRENLLFSCYLGEGTTPSVWCYSRDNHQSHLTSLLSLQPRHAPLGLTKPQPSFYWRTSTFYPARRDVFDALTIFPSQPAGEYI